MILGLVMSEPVGAEFSYIPPGGERASFSVVEGDEQGWTLGAQLEGLLPEGLTVRYDRRVAVYGEVLVGYPDWESLLYGEGLVGVLAGDVLKVRPAGVAAADVVLVAGGEGVGRWRVEEGELLRVTLERWGERAGVEVLWLTDRRYVLHRSRVYEGTFTEAARAVVFGLSHLPHPPVCELSSDGSSMVVVHRVAGIGVEGGDGDG